METTRTCTRNGRARGASSVFAVLLTVAVLAVGIVVFFLIGGPEQEPAASGSGAVDLTRGSVKVDESRQARAAQAPPTKSESGAAGKEKPIGDNPEGRAVVNVPPRVRDKHKIGSDLEADDRRDADALARDKYWNPDNVPLTKEQLEELRAILTRGTKEGYALLEASGNLKVAALEGAIEKGTATPLELGKSMPQNTPDVKYVSGNSSKSNSGFFLVKLSASDYPDIWKADAAHDAHYEQLHDMIFAFFESKKPAVSTSTSK